MSKNVLVEYSKRFWLLLLNCAMVRVLNPHKLKVINIYSFVILTIVECYIVFFVDDCRYMTALMPARG